MTTDPPRGAAVIGQAGGPTAVINQSLVGVVEGLRAGGLVGRVLGARHGVRGMVDDRFVDLTDTPDAALDRVARTPSAALGSTRDKPDEAYCERIFDRLRAREVRYFFYIGGNDSADTCRIVNEVSNAAGYELRCFHVPKTIDNDLIENDHTPGYPSAARFVAHAFTGDNLDNASLGGVKINIVMGRHAGFLTAASALARRREDDGPHLIYLPERDFDPARFVADVDRVYSKLGRCLVAVSEGIHNAAGEPISALMSGLNECDAHGNVQLSGSGALGDWLANLIRVELTPAGGKPLRVRADTFGYLQRCYPDPSPVDQREARAVGRTAAEVALLGDLDGSVAIRRVRSAPYECRFELERLSAVAGKTRVMPEEFLDGEHGVTPAFLDYARPLVGDLAVVERL
ncbi:MAG: 6-phosphofructokinase [Planctomycetota bacterium]|nr:MAG: 6-phosphofructokinase [Planctomycetota bacterium]